MRADAAAARFLGGMAQFKGRLQGKGLEPSRVLIDIGEGRFRVSAGRLHVGSWALERVTAERTSIYRFSLDIDGEAFDFYPEDPTTFSDAIGAYIDLTESKGRFGLRQRLDQAGASQ
jgi:hypothetical protein